MNNQQLENIDLKKADQQYYHRLRVFNERNHHSIKRNSISGNNQHFTHQPTQRLGSGVHNRSYNIIDTENLGVNEEPQIIKPENPYQDHPVCEEENLMKKRENEEFSRPK